MGGQLEGVSVEPGWVGGQVVQAGLPGCLEWIMCPVARRI